VRRHGIGGGLPALGGMAACAVAGIGACGELPPMDVLVAGLTLHVRHRGLEVGGLVTLIAGHRRVLAEQREFLLGMVERRDGIARRLAAGGKRTAMRVLVTIGALSEGDTGVADDFRCGVGRRQRAVAPGALHLGMGAGEFVFGGGMVEPRDIFPFGGRVGDRVTALAFIAQLALMLILVAGRASRA